jgi:hypothetical protein
MKKRMFISTGAAPKTLRLTTKKVIIGKNPKNKTGYSYAFIANKQDFTVNLFRLVRSFQELPGSLIVSVQNHSGVNYPVAVVYSETDLRSELLKHRASEAEWCLQKLADFQSCTIVFQPARVG